MPGTSRVRSATVNTCLATQPSATLGLGSQAPACLFGPRPCLARAGSVGSRALAGDAYVRALGSVRSVPELPEVETVRRRLAPLLEGRVFAEVEIADARLTRPFDPLVVARELDGERVDRSAGAASIC